MKLIYEWNHEYYDISEAEVLNDMSSPSRSSPQRTLRI